MTFLRDVKDNWICTEEASGKGLVFFSFYIGFHLKNLICSCPSLKPFFLILEIPRLRCSPFLYSDTCLFYPEMVGLNRADLLRQGPTWGLLKLRVNKQTGCHYSSPHMDS